MNTSESNAESHPLSRAFAYGLAICETAMTPQCVVKLSTPGYVAIVDRADRELIEQHSWWAVKRSHTTYAATKIGTKTVLMHRMLMGLADVADRTQVVDHIDHDGLLNSRQNLRPASQTNNLGNARPRKGGTSRFKGVSWSTRDKVWTVSVRQRHVGNRKDEVEAAKLYDQAAREEFGSFALLNFPEA